MAALDAVCVSPESCPIQFLGVWGLFHYQSIYLDEADKRIQVVLLQLPYAHLLDDQTLDLHRID